MYQTTALQNIQNKTDLTEGKKINPQLLLNISISLSQQPIEKLDRKSDRT
jgi:hypothetical protein